MGVEQEPHQACSNSSAISGLAASIESGTVNWPRATPKRRGRTDFDGLHQAREVGLGLEHVDGATTRVARCSCSCYGARHT